MIQDWFHPSTTCYLTPDERRALLHLARTTAMQALSHPAAATATTSHAPTAQASSAGCGDESALRTEKRFGGVFVTLWRGKTLRGCIGTLTPIEDPARAVPEVTRSALVDARFVGDPVVASELPELRIEISLLSEPKRTTDPLSLIPGTHGLIVRRGAHSGCFLPKVAAERDWTAEMTLRNCCEMKAGLPADAWRDTTTQVMLFTAETFSDGTSEDTHGCGAPVEAATPADQAT